MMRLKAYSQTDIDVGSYWRPQKGQMTFTVVEYLQGIQMAKEAMDYCKNGSGNPAIVYRQFTRADNAHTKHDMCSNALWRRYY
jgi:hypothetical protein